MNNSEVLKEFELNEFNFWSDWAETRWVEEGRVYAIRSKDFREPLFNHVGIVSAPSDLSKIVAKNEEYFKEIKSNPSVFVPALEDYQLLAKSLVKEGYKPSDSLLVLEMKERMMKPREDVEVSLLTRRGVMEWVRVYLQSFYNGGFYREKVYEAVKRSAGRDDVKLLLARVKGLPVGCTALHFDERVVGAYCVGVIPEYRNRGVASSMLWFASLQETLQGRRLILQTFESDNLESWYSRLGFLRVYQKQVLMKQLFEYHEEVYGENAIPQTAVQKALNLGVSIKRSLDVDKYIFADVFKGFENVPALLSVFGKELPEVLRSTYVVVDPREGYLHVDNENGWIYISQPYLREADERYLYLDLVHELVHVKQFHEGRELYDWDYSYFERPTEVEAYEVTIREARRIGMRDEEIADYLRVEWVGEDEFKSFLRKMKVKTKI
ncbi:MAG: GNAT family N-acetyltransferase [Conexivisphaerales archaeon]